MNVPTSAPPLIGPKMRPTPIAPCCRMTPRPTPCAPSSCPVIAWREGTRKATETPSTIDWKNSIQYESRPLTVSTPSSSACTISSTCAATSTVLREKRSVITPAPNIEGNSASPKAKSWAATAVFDPVRS